MNLDHINCSPPVEKPRIVLFMPSSELLADRGCKHMRYNGKYVGMITPEGVSLPGDKGLKVSMEVFVRSLTLDKG